jgi:hypothetical protein
LNLLKRKIRHLYQQARETLSLFCALVRGLLVRMLSDLHPLLDWFRGQSLGLVHQLRGY